MERLETLQNNLTAAAPSIEKSADAPADRPRIAVPRTQAAARPKKTAGRFNRAPEVILTLAALIGVSVIPLDWYSPADLSDGFSQFLIVLCVPFALAIFVLGGAALWRAIRGSC